MSADLSLDLAAAREVIATAGAALSEAARSTPDAAVPWCDGWTVASVLAHVACVHEWVAGMVDEAATDPPPFPSAPIPVAAGSQLADWADDCRRRLLKALAEADADRPMWAFGSQRPTRFWARRQAHETAVHTFDATAATGHAWVIPADVADDGLAEFLTMLLPRWRHRPPAWGEGRTVHFHRTDGDGERLLTIGPRAQLRPGHGGADLAVRGPAHDLLLWTLNRPASVDLFGDLELASDWKDNVRF